jgi:hypothetical protein
VDQYSVRDAAARKKFHNDLLQKYRTLLQDHCALQSYRQLEARLSRIGYQLTFMDVPMVNDYFTAKMRTYLGAICAALLAVRNADRFLMFLRTNFDVRAIPAH